MSTVRVFTADRMQDIEDQAIVGGSIIGNNLWLTRNNSSSFNAGNVRGPQGDQGDPGEITAAELSDYLPKYTSTDDLVADSDLTHQAALVYLNASYRYVLARRQGTLNTWVASLGPVAISDTTDELGVIYAPASDYGFENVVGVIANLAWAADFNSVQLASARIVGGDVQIRAYYLFEDQSTAFGAIVPAADMAVTGSIMLTGVFA